MKSASGLQYMKRLWRQRFWRYLCTIPLYDLLIYMLCMGWLPDCLTDLIVPLMIGGLMLLGIIGGAVWAGLPGLRWYTAAIYTLLSVLIFTVGMVLAPVFDAVYQLPAKRCKAPQMRG